MKNTKLITEPIIYTSARLESIANRFVFVPMGTTAATVKILGLLKNHGSLTPNRIMELAGGTKSNVSQRLNNLEKNKYIVRDYAVFPDDKRKVIVRLTKIGEEHLEIIRKRMNKAKFCLSTYFTKKEIDNHIQFFTRINKVLDNAEENLVQLFK